MKKQLIFRGFFSFIAMLTVVTALSVRPALALEGDGLTSVSCSGRYTIATRTWGKATMHVYGCSKGYVFTHVNSTTTWAKSARITRDNPYATRWSDTTGYSRYATTTNMLRYVRGTCYTASGSSVDSNYGQTVSVRWCYW